MSEEYLWDRSGPVDLDIARLERVLGRLRLPDLPPALTLPPEWLRAQSPQTLSPEALSPEALSPEALSPEALSSEALSPQAQPSQARPGQELPSEALPRQPLPSEPALPVRAPMTRYVLPFAVAATLAIAVGSIWLSRYWTPPRGTWQVSRLDGAPRIASTTVGETPGDFSVGDTLETDARARARIRVPHVGRIDVEPDTRVGLLSTRAGDYRLRLDRGTLQALIWSAPGQFHVETPSAIAIDLGCAYTLRVSEDGSETVVQVTSGWVALESIMLAGGVPDAEEPEGASSGGASREKVPSAISPFQKVVRSAFVRAGATGIARRGAGPGTPYANDVSAAVKEALHTIDFGPAAPAARAAALDRVLAEARPNDAVMLWHLLWLSRVHGADRDRVFDRLASFAPPPSDVTRGGIRNGSPAMLNRWWTGSRLGPPRGSR